ncbi:MULTISPECIES: hypothetical protein [Microbacterium]|jgi:hypothetical protein|uniref:hypothetical protein n=1 Tax=Microbacterium TaxID=33882 RepID=UPI0004933CE1|nr:MULTISPECIES: hypothetical protein [Microbacterium]AVL96161.1 hypothetical protein C6C15_03035 [Microbacterium sp. str. 'China']KYJ98124.1 hypothetical protein AUV07_12640 [Microbacterium sp. CH1]MCT1394458.1 hypothetical protein [Microbacterium sp. p3-SID338]MDH5132028.1 hypothetical protein [Microbacterium sp. RD10]MDH5135709.1 hypothetical protein [Microbacterium sp. RD11]
MRRTRSQLRAAQIAALQAEQDAYDKNVNDAIKVAAFARCDAVEQLYELLDVQPEPPIIRDGKHGRYEVTSDKDEAKRAARLIEAVTVLLSIEEQPTTQPVGSDRQVPAQAAERPPQAASPALVATTSSTPTAVKQPAA